MLFIEVVMVLNWSRRPKENPCRLGAKRKTLALSLLLFRASDCLLTLPASILFVAHPLPGVITPYGTLSGFVIEHTPAVPVCMPPDRSVTLAVNA